MKREPCNYKIPQAFSFNPVKMAFSDFEYEGIHYAYIASRLSEGIIEQQGVRITDPDGQL